MEGTVCFFSSFMSPPGKKMPHSHLITGLVAQESLPLAACIVSPFQLVLCRGRRERAACHSRPSSAIRGLSRSVHSLESRLKPHACLSKRSTLHARNTDLMLRLGRWRVIRKLLQASAPRQGAVVTYILCPSVPIAATAGAPGQASLAQTHASGHEQQREGSGSPGI